MWQGRVHFIIGIWLMVSSHSPDLIHPFPILLSGLISVIFGFWAYRRWEGIALGLLGVVLFIYGCFFWQGSGLNLIRIGILETVLGGGLSTLKQNGKIVRKNQVSKDFTPNEGEQVFALQNKRDARDTFSSN